MCSPASPTIRPGASPSSCPGTGNRSTPPAPPPELARSPNAYCQVGRGAKITGLRTVRRQLQQCDISGYHESLAAAPAGTIEDHHGMRISGDLAADLAEMMIHGGSIPDRHDQR